MSVIFGGQGLTVRASGMGGIGPTGPTGPQGVAGATGAIGQGFVIAQVYNSEAERIAASGASLPGDGEFALIAGTLSPSSDDYGKLYLWKNNAWVYQTDMSVQGVMGPTGATGAQGDQGIQGVAGATGATGATGPATYPASGIAVSTGTAWTTSKASPTGVIVGTTDSQTLSNKTLLNFGETVYALSYSATLAPNQANGSIQTVTLTGNVTINGFTSPVSGQTITLILTQDATGSRTLSSTMKFAGGTKTLSTAANSIDILTITYVGSVYYASLTKGYV